jgi:Cu(I)/Ag(I) efflux system membrane fusion protein
MKTIKIILIILVALVAGFFIRGWTTSSDQSLISNSNQQPEIWTCSMHPQIQLPKFGKCPICFMDLIPLEAGSDSGGERELSISRYSAKLMDIETTLVEHRFAEAEISMVGKVDYDETRLSTISAWVPGRIDRLFVDYTGMPVQEGDHLAELFSPELLNAQKELLLAIKQSPEMLDSVRERFRLWGFDAEQIRQLEERGEASDHMTIHATSGGIVIHRNASEGMYVETGTKLFTIADLSRVWVKLDAYESDIQWLRYGNAVEFSVEAFPGETFAGTISFIDPMIDPATRTAKLRIIVENTDNKLKPGMFVRAVARPQVAGEGGVMNPDLAGKWISPMHPEVIKDEPGPCDVCGMPLVTAESLGYVAEDSSTAPLLIPVTAALKTGKRAVVYVEIPDQEKPTYEGREVLLGPRLGDFYIVNNGLEEGERVVTRGAFKLDAELQIQAKPSMMSMPSEQLTDQPAEMKPQTHCPVMGGKINKEVYTDYNDMRIYFCCAGCDTTFKEDPDKYLNQMKAQGIVPEKAEQNHVH